MLDSKLLAAIFKDDEEALDIIRHEGVAHDENPPGPGSGRYAWGTGTNAYQRVNGFVSQVENLKKYRNLTDEDIATLKGYPNVEQFRKRYLYEKEYAGQPNKFCSYIDALRAEKGENGKRKYSDDEIAKMVGVKDADALKDHYKYSKAVWEKVPANYKIDSDFDRQLKSLKDEGYSPAQIAIGLGISTQSLKARASIATNAAKLELIEKNRILMEGIKAEDGTWIQEPITNRSERARILGLAEPTLRSREKGQIDENAQIIFNTADKLREAMAENKYLDVGLGTAERMGVKPDRLTTAIEILKLEGFDTINVQVDQMGSKKGNKTTIQALVPPGTTYQQLKEDVAKKDDIIGVYNSGRSEDGGETFRKIEEPTSIDSKRIFIKYAEEGGVDKDGLIELRRGVDDISLGRAAYAQVRIAVDGQYYLKGMAMHTDNIPEGYDILVNSNKKAGTPIEDVFKKFDPKKSIPGNPFGTSIKTDPDEGYIIQRHYIDPKTGEEKLSAINVVNAEGDWSKWSKTVASQMLAKQSPDLVKKQLEQTYEAREKEFNEIMSLTNSVVRKRLLDEFEKNTDKAAVDLKAVSFTNQSTRVILPYPTMKEKECYCPGYDDGEMVALVRYPHGGIFEIPLLKVNNKFKEAKKDLGECRDAIGIHPTAATTLSGADFDGDTVICIPVRDKNGNKITPVTTSEDIDMKPYMKLRDFDTKTYKLPKEVVYEADGVTRRKDPRVMQDEKARGKQMGIATNLIADLTAKRADPEDIVNAVMYSMVVVDAYKHGLDWKQAKKDFHIDQINKKYRSSGGSDTIMTKAKSPYYVLPRKEKTAVSKMTPEELEKWYAGEKLYDYPTKTVAWRDKETGEYHQVEKTGKREKSYRMAETDNPNTLLSDTPTEIEMSYASFATRLKELAKNARKESRAIKTYSKNTDPELKEKYKDEIDSLRKQKTKAISLKPLEKKAQAYANRLFDIFMSDNPDLDEEHYDKQRGKLIEQARKRVGAKQTRIDITDREWEAIQSGVISASELGSILDYADMDKVKKLAMPRSSTVLSTAQIQYAENAIANGKSVAQIANDLGVSASTIRNNVDETVIRHSVIIARTQSDQNMPN